MVTCGACGGTGKVRNEDVLGRDGRWIAGRGYVPCGTCRGRRVVEQQKESANASDVDSGVGFL